MLNQMGWILSGGVAVLALMACGSTPTPSEIPAVAQGAKPSVSTPAAPEVTPVEAVEPVAQTEEPPAPSTGSEPPRKHRNNPRRLFQLGDLQVVKIKIGEHEFNTWVMDTNAKRSEGMMFLENQDFTETDAMIFVFKNPEPLGFWMRNTLVDLDIAYVNAKNMIIRTTTMKALDENSVPSNGPALYAIEFKAKLLQKKGIRAGMKVEIPKSVVAKE